MSTTGREKASAVFAGWALFGFPAMIVFALYVWVFKTLVLIGQIAWLLGTTIVRLIRDRRRRT